jgi:ubiquinone/menaquinone biosynthesis C-methylase UbiE
MDYHEHLKRYYDRRASEYEEHEAFREEPSEDLPALLHAISLLPPARVLDVACGTGFLTQHLGSEVRGLDQSEAMLEVARRRVPWAEFLRADAFRMPFADNSFERVFASFFYGLLPLADRGRFLGEARRVGGELILLEPTPEWAPSGRAEGLGRTPSFRRLALRDLPKVLHGRCVRPGTRWPNPLRGKIDGDGQGR